MGATFAALPDDVQRRIFQNANAKNIDNLKQSSKDLHRIFKDLARAKATTHAYIHKDKGKHLRDLVSKVLDQIQAMGAGTRNGKRRRKVLKEKFISATIDDDGVGRWFGVRISNLMTQTEWKYHPRTNTALLYTTFGVSGQVVGVAMALRSAGVKVAPGDRLAKKLLTSMGWRGL